MKSWEVKSMEHFLFLRFNAIIFASKVHGTFCAGADVKERLGMREDEALDFVSRLRLLFDKISVQQL
jgi:enoyl-CoA hydratase/carnithine racemase